MLDVDVHEDNENKYIHYMRVKKTNELDIVQMGYHNTPSLYEYGPMVRDHLLIHFVVRGSGRLTLRGHVYDVYAGECFLISPYEIASYVSNRNDPWEYFWLGFTGFGAAQFVDKAGFSQETPVIRTRYMQEIAENFQLADGRYMPENIMMYKSIAYRVLYYLMTDHPASHEASRPSPIREMSPSKRDYVGKVVSIIETSFDQRLSVKELADMMSINQNYLCKIFKEEMGVSIKGYLTEYRLDIAAAKLLCSEKNITEIAAESGFQDSLYFSRIFRKRFGTCPSEYRANSERMG